MPDPQDLPLDDADLQDPLEPLVQGAHAGIDRLAAAGDEWREAGAVMADELRQTVRTHPLASIAAAAAVGWLIGRLVR